jgi:SpoVK/Ycf46/Vps4 family AAA+-type ATPase
LERIRRRIAHGPAAYERHKLGALTELRLNAIFFGPPGTGKTSAFLTVTQGIVERRVSVSLRGLVGSHLGDTEANLQELSAFFARYANEPGRLAVLLDDADDFLSARGNDDSAAGQTLNALKVGMLKLLDSAQAVTVVLTTNRLKALDSAIHRRIVDHVEFPLPDEPSRRAMIKGFLQAILNPPTLPTADDEALMAKQSEGLSPAEIVLAVVDAVIVMSQRPNGRFADVILSGLRWRNQMKSKWEACPNATPL